MFLLMLHPSIAKSPCNIFGIQYMSLVLGSTIIEATVACSNECIFDSFNMGFGFHRT